MLRRGPRKEHPYQYVNKTTLIFLNYCLKTLDTTTRKAEVVLECIPLS